MTHTSQWAKRVSDLLAPSLRREPLWAAHQVTRRAHPDSCERIEVCMEVLAGNTLWEMLVQQPHSASRPNQLQAATAELVQEADVYAGEQVPGRTRHDAKWPLRPGLGGDGLSWSQARKTWGVGAGGP